MSRLYQINARVLVNSFVPSVKSVADIPSEYWESIKSTGIDFIWLMGVWHTSPSSIPKYCYHPNLIDEYNLANPQWNKTDVGGSPYAIDSYHISPLIGQQQLDLLEAKKKINAAGMRLILDFVPNHLNSESDIIYQHPEYFFHKNQINDDDIQSMFFATKNGFYAHGRDPYFDPWTDTVQLNYFRQETHDYMYQVLSHVSELCDGVRCDMAMLILPDIFEKTWSRISTEKVPQNFWKTSISGIKSNKTDFVFIAEAYWGTEWRLQQDGFDFTYDKTLLDLLVEGNLLNLRNHLGAELSYRRKMMHFIENHDEPRSQTSFGREKARAASVIISTIPGMTLFFDGQWEGARKKLPVQLAIPAQEIHCACSVKSSLDDTKICTCQYNHYKALLEATDHPILKHGHWEMLNQDQMGDLMAWMWSLNREKVIVFVNYTSNYLIAKISTDFDPNTVNSYTDLLSNYQNPDYFQFDKNNTWQIELAAYQCSIIQFSFKDQS